MQHFVIGDFSIGFLLVSLKIFKCKVRTCECWVFSHVHFLHLLSCTNVIRFLSKLFNHVNAHRKKFLWVFKLSLKKHESIGASKTLLSKMRCVNHWLNSNGIPRWYWISEMKTHIPSLSDFCLRRKKNSSIYVHVSMLYTWRCVYNKR